MIEIPVQDYLVDFPNGAEGSLRHAALAEAHKNRKFEIDLYWKRATYFWTFIAAAFAGYFLLQNGASNSTTSFVVACLGFVFSLSWYFVNRGSKY
jgi:lipopolysaccharide export LptBFGC system permease protein LptF